MLKRVGKYIAVLKRSVSLLLAVTTVWGGLAVSLGASAEEVYRLDYTSVEGGQMSTAAQGDVVAGLVGTGLLAAERNYLEAYSKHSVEYTSDVPAGYYTATMLDGKIYAVAKPYKYTAFNGQTVSFTPVYAEVGESRMPLLWSQRDGAYCAFLEGARRETVKFTFAAGIEIPDDAALVMINEAYFAAVAMDKAQDDYEAQHSVWSDKNGLYQEYLTKLNTYNAAKEAFLLYQKAVAKYETDLDNYNKWWNDYDAQKALRDRYDIDYSRYEENQSAIAEYDRQLLAYESYMELVNASPELVEEYERKAVAAQKHLDIIDSFYREITPKRHSFWGVISSSFVKFIFENRDEIISLGATREDIRKAEEAHFYLVSIFEDYAALQTKAEKYTYVAEQLDDMKYYVTRLGEAIRDMAAVEKVRNRIKAEGLLDEFYEFIGIIYYCECALYNDKTFDANEKYYDTPMSSVLEVNLLVADENALVLLEDGWPTPPVTSDDVTPVEHPGNRPVELDEPTYVAPPPDKSTAPEKPTSPQEVEDPGDTPPTAVADPGEEPSAPARDSIEEALYQEYLNGKITYRTKTSSNFAQVYSTVSKKADNVRVQVIAYDGENIVHEVFVSFGSSLESVLETPSDKTIGGKTYEFAGWSDSPSGNPMDVSYVSSTDGKLTLYSVYRIKLDETVESSNVQTETIPNPAITTEPLTTEPITTEEVTETATETDTETETETETETGTETDTETETGTETETDTETEKGTETETVTETETGAETDTETETETGTATETVTETKTETETETETVAKAPVTSADITSPPDVDYEAPSVSPIAKILGSIGLVPLLIIGGVTVGAAAAGGAIGVISVADVIKRRARKRKK